MFSKLEEISFVGMSNSELFLAEKDLTLSEFNLLLRPTLEFSDGCRIVASEDYELHRQRQQQEEEEEKKDEKSQVVVSSEELKRPSLGGEFKVEDDDDGFRTPTSLDHKIPVFKQCPPAPRKPMSQPSKKRKAPSNRQQLMFDLSEEIESLFPQALVADLGRKIKKVRVDKPK